METPNIIIDAHEDIAYNALTFGRDHRKSALAMRAEEAGGPIPARASGQAMLGMSEWLLGRVGIVFATLFAAPWHRRFGDWDTQCYRDQAEAFRLYRAQLDYYLRLADEHPQIEIIYGQRDLDRVLASWHSDDLIERKIGLVILIEGADALGEPGDAEYWFDHGVRLIGPAWSRTRYAGGTRDPGPLTDDGRRLLNVMAGLGMMLDLSHLSDEGMFEGLDRYEGVVLATHVNPRKFGGGPPERYMRDDHIRWLAERDGVVGIIPCNGMLVRDWTPTLGKQAVTIDEHVVAAIDHVCQVTGSAQHVGIGSDFDGGFGMERTPAEIDTVADLYKIGEALSARGYNQADVDAVMRENWLRMLRRGLPA